MTAKRGLRRCLACGGSKPAKEMLRFVLDPEANVVFDRKRNLPGRGINICPEAKCLQIGLTAGKLTRGFKGAQPAFDPQLLQKTVVESYRSRIFSLITLSRISGKLVEGRTKAETALENGKAAVLILAEELAERTSREFIERANNAGLPVVIIGSMEELSGDGEYDRLRAIFVVNDKEMAKTILEVYEKLEDISGIADGQS